jgi:hypothetical protein
MFLSFVHDIRGIHVIGGYAFGCGGAALDNPRLSFRLSDSRKKNAKKSLALDTAL